MPALLTICWPGLVLCVCLTEQDTGNTEEQMTVSATKPSQLHIQLLERRCSFHVVLNPFVMIQGFKGLHFPGHALNML